MLLYLPNRTYQNLHCILPIKPGMLESISPTKYCQFAQLALLILLLPVICPVPQNKRIYTGGLLALWEG